LAHSGQSVLHTARRRREPLPRVRDAYTPKETAGPFDPAQ